MRRGALFARRCSFTDPGADTWTGTVSYGDGTGARALRLHADKTFVLSHRFRVARGRAAPSPSGCGTTRPRQRCRALQGDGTLTARSRSAGESAQPVTV